MTHPLSVERVTVTGLMEGARQNINLDLPHAFVCRSEFIQALCADWLRKTEALEAILTYGELANVSVDNTSFYAGGKKPASKDVWQFPRHMLPDIEAAAGRAALLPSQEVKTP